MDTLEERLETTEEQIEIIELRLDSLENGIVAETFDSIEYTILQKVSIELQYIREEIQELRSQIFVK